MADDKIIFYEPQFNRWHDKLSCAVLMAQEEIEIRLVEVAPEGSRPCSVCAKLPESCD